MKKKWIDLLLLSFITLFSSAQTDGYKFYSKLDSVKTPGFYNIELTPELNAHLKTDYSDVRIINENGKWVPHILHSPSMEQTNAPLIMNLKFSITETPGTNTDLVIESGQTISSNIGLVITNTAAERFCTLSGSNDRNKWFIINDSIIINPVPGENATENFFRIDFPPNSYRYYKIVIHNNTKDPFNIKSAGTYTTGGAITNPFGRIIENPPTTSQQKDSGKITYVKITQTKAFHFDNISLELSGIRYYFRRADLYIPYSENNSFAEPGRLWHSFTLSNNSTLQFNVPLTKARVFYLLISNDDNLPLRINAVKTAYNNRYITTYLEPGPYYKLILDNKEAVMPDYDLLKLNTKIPDSIPFLQFGKVFSVEENKLTVVAERNNNWMLWSAIIAALIILLFFTYRMLKEVGK